MSKLKDVAQSDTNDSGCRMDRRHTASGMTMIMQLLSGPRFLVADRTAHFPSLKKFFAIVQIPGHSISDECDSVSHHINNEDGSVAQKF